MIVMTWNMQGAQASADPTTPKGKRKRLEGTNISDVISNLSHGIDVLLLQETGGAPEGWELESINVGGFTLDRKVIGIGTRTRRREVMVVWYDSYANSAANHNRCSMAIISTTFKNTATSISTVEHGSKGLRPLIGLETAGGTWVYSIHAPSGNPTAAAKTSTKLLKAIPVGQNFICAGDYNCDPALMKPSGFNVIHSSGHTHQGGNTLDYAVGRGVTITYLPDHPGGLISDHYSQAFQVQ